MTAFPSPPVPGELAIISLTGSRAYGTERPDSDWDFRGVYIAPTVDTFRLQPPQESVDLQDPDVTIYELRKFCALAAACNPSVLEILWSPEIRTTVSGRILVDHREAFLSRRAFKTYGGYAMSQLRRFRDGTGGSRGVAHLRRPKYILHTYRLMEVGIELLATGRLNLAVADPAAAWARAEAALARPEQLEEDFLRLNEDLVAALRGSPLPEEPDREAIDDLILRIRGLH